MNGTDNRSDSERHECPRCKTILRHDCGNYYWCKTCRKVWEKITEPIYDALAELEGK
jgi:hypothetical protein